MSHSFSDEAFIEPLSDFFRCPVCLCCLENPYQTPCGHRFCKDCITPVVHSRNPICPIDRKPIPPSNVFPDNATQLQINSLKVQCIHVSCSWKGEYSDWEHHYKTCEHSVTQCELCGLDISNAHLCIHQENDCAHRKVDCKYCKVKLPFIQLSTHQENDCQEYPVGCHHGCEDSNVRRQDMVTHKSFCPAYRVSCILSTFGCPEKVRRDQFESHAKQCAIHHIHKMAAVVVDLQEQVQSLKLMVEEKTQSINSLKALLYPCSGQFTWRIDDIEGKIKAAQSGDPATTSIYSPEFFSSEGGYKICLCVYPAGDNNQGFLSLYFVLMKGPFDEVLPWPFSKRVILTLLSTSASGQPLVKDIQPDPRLHYFKKPENARNVGYGYPKLISLARLLKDTDYVENGVIFIRAIIFP